MTGYALWRVPCAVVLPCLHALSSCHERSRSIPPHSPLCRMLYLPEAHSDRAKAPRAEPSEIISPPKNKNEKEQLFSSGVLS